jgi:hypothetical protein
MLPKIRMYRESIAALAAQMVGLMTKRIARLSLMNMVVIVESGISQACFAAPF